MKLIYLTIPWILPSKNKPSVTENGSKNLPKPEGLWDTMSTMPLYYPFTSFIYIAVILAKVYYSELKYVLFIAYLFIWSTEIDPLLINFSLAN